jgi:hypothetical protein
LPNYLLNPQLLILFQINSVIAEHLDERIKRKAALMGGFFNLVGDADEISKQLLNDIEVFSQFRALFE